MFGGGLSATPLYTSSRLPFYVHFKAVSNAWLVYNLGLVQKKVSVFLSNKTGAFVRGTFFIAVLLVFFKVL